MISTKVIAASKRKSPDELAGAGKFEIISSTSDEGWSHEGLMKMKVGLSKESKHVFTLSF